MPNRFSFIVPFHSGLSSLTQCLTALDSRPPESELIIAEDCATEDCRPLALEHGARVIAVRRRGGPSGPAVARNVAAASAIGDVLVFVDADVVVSRTGPARMSRLFAEQPRTAAVFGSYDERPADPGFMSQYKNLSHSFIHQSSATQARTFWAGFGAVRREAFHLVGGFDERFDRPSVEDIDLGYRLTEAGYQVVLDPTLSACNLKRWTMRSAMVSDVRDRGIPWTQLILRYGALRDDLNLRPEHRWSIVLAYLALASLMLALYDRRFLAGLPLFIVALAVLNRRYYGFFHQKRGAWFAVRVWVLHVLHHLCNGVSFATGAGLFFAARYLGLRLPRALSVDAWSATLSRSASATAMRTLALPTIGRLPPIKYVHVQTHTRCNADCVFCPWIESEHAANPGTMSDGLWSHVLDNLRPFAKGINAGKFCPYLMQEPLIDKTIFAKIADIYQYFPQTCVEISTNGAALTDKVVDRLFEAFAGRRHDLWLSHHGIDAPTLQHIMKIDYDKAHRNLISLLKKADGRFTIRIRGAGESRDGKHVYFTREQYKEYWERNFREHGINTNNVSVDAFTFHDRAATLHREDRGACHLNMGTVRQIDPQHPFYCDRVDEWIHIMYDGRIRLCSMDYHGEVKLPSLLDMRLVDYFLSDEYRDLVERVSGRKESPPDLICKRCTSPGG